MHNILTSPPNKAYTLTIYRRLAGPEYTHPCRAQICPNWPGGSGNVVLAPVRAVGDLAGSCLLFSFALCGEATGALTPSGDEKGRGGFWHVRVLPTGVILVP